LIKFKFGTTELDFNNFGTTEVNLPLFYFCLRAGDPAPNDFSFLQSKMYNPSPTVYKTAVLRL